MQVWPPRVSQPAQGSNGLFWAGLKPSWPFSAGGRVWDPNMSLIPSSGGQRLTASLPQCSVNELGHPGAAHGRLLLRWEFIFCPKCSVWDSSLGAVLSCWPILLAHAAGSPCSPQEQRLGLAPCSRLGQAAIASAEQQAGSCRVIVC